ncbi:hypothetical protein SAMN05216490_3864 [Mucilaginibacter mallensis]|uniref:Uncharacterized protein n=1 Tax=Mucilaginibacter mallensis TaxID=652787 RepID=A0A1H2B387_MUCMA|nr:hypothetical protein SAMN05216490_3864 [Mucilaginibacter mallensis]
MDKAYLFTVADGTQMKYAGLWDYNKILNILNCTIIPDNQMK